MRRIISARNHRITRSTFHPSIGFPPLPIECSVFLSLSLSLCFSLSTGILSMSYGVTYRLAWKRLARVASEFYANGNGLDVPRPSEVIWPAWHGRDNFTVSSIGNAAVFISRRRECFWHGCVFVAIKNNDFGSRTNMINLHYIEWNHDLV